MGGRDAACSAASAVGACAGRGRGSGQLGRHFDAETADCLVAAAWLHDIGYAPSVRQTGFHPLDGAMFARSAGFGELVASLVAFS